MAATTCSRDGRAGSEARIGVNARRKYSRKSWSSPQQRITETPVRARAAVGILYAAIDVMKDGQVLKNDRGDGRARAGSIGFHQQHRASRGIFADRTGRDACDGLRQRTVLPGCCRREAVGTQRAGLSQGRRSLSSPLRLDQRVPGHVSRHPDRKVGDVRADQCVRLAEVEIAHLHGEAVRSAYLAVARIAVFRTPLIMAN